MFSRETWHLPIDKSHATILAWIQHRPFAIMEGSDYRTRFWENQGRDYEDQAERSACAGLCQQRVRRCSMWVRIRTGLADEYAGYEKIVLLDYSSSLLREAKARLDPDPRFVYVAATWYKMPFVGGLFETWCRFAPASRANVPGLMSGWLAFFCPTVITSLNLLTNTT